MPPAAEETARPRVSLALQGGGAHGAFTWGVLDRLLEDGRIEVEGVCGTSAGAMNGVALAYGLARGGPAEARSILTGLKIGWAFAWRTLIAAELVFGVSSGQGGLGWFIFENRNLLDIPAVFAGLLTVIVIGLIVENLIFRTIERNTVQKWGTQS